MKTLILKIAAWLHGESYIQAFIDSEVKQRLEKLYLGLKLYTAYDFHSRRDFYMYLLMQGLDVMEKIYQRERSEQNELQTDEISIR